ncbi:MAG: penicillin-binding protein 2 [Anaerolineales bacterium]|nr:penicillin-binding protein 2 [Anaerolineales bacterium]
MTELSSQIKVRTWRIQVLMAGLLISSLLVFGWTVSFQLIPEAQEIRLRGDQMDGFVRMVKPPRGPIYDMDGYLLAGNHIVYEVGIDLPSVVTPEPIAQVLNATIGLNYEDALYYASIPPSPEAVYAQVARTVSSEEANALIEIYNEWLALYKEGKTKESLMGLVLYPRLARTYPEGDLASQVLGLVGMDDFSEYERGYHGLEERFDSELSGAVSEMFVPFNPNQAAEQPSVPPGATLILTLDRDIQAMVEDILDLAREEYKAKSANAIILDPETGAIRAMASSPRLDPNRLDDVDHYKEVYPEGVPFNRLISQTFEPGSVMKIFTMAAAVDNGDVELDTQFFDPGFFEYGGITIRNWNRQAGGKLNMIGCLQHSSNVCLAWVGTEMGAEAFYTYMDAFGFGHFTSVDLANEATGRMKEPGDSDWYPADLATNTFGQGVSVTALQVVTAAGALANEGQTMVPHVTQAMVDNGVQVPFGPTVYGNPIRPETAQAMTQALALSLENEASLALVPGYRMAGKTGTAQIPGDEGYLKNKTNASFIGWGPVDDPQFVIYVWLEEPEPTEGSDTAWGSTIAAPIFSQIAQRLVVMMKLPPDLVREQIGMSD